MEWIGCWLFFAHEQTYGTSLDSDPLDPTRIQAIMRERFKPLQPARKGNPAFSSNGPRRVCYADHFSHVKAGPVKFPKCSACFRVVCCSPACQTHDWPRHKRDCRAKTKGLRHRRQRQRTPRPMTVQSPDSTWAPFRIGFVLTVAPRSHSLSFQRRNSRRKQRLRDAPFVLRGGLDGTGPCCSVAVLQHDLGRRS